MYLVVVVALMGILPVACIATQLVVGHGGADPLLLTGRWFVFWSVGIRLILAGLRQVLNPAFTAEAIFGIKETGALVIVQELGFGNLSIGLPGALSLGFAQWTVPAAISGGLFYGLAGIKHLGSRARNTNETIAMVSDLFVFVVLALYLAGLALRSD